MMPGPLEHSLDSSELLLLFEGISGGKRAPCCYSFGIDVSS